MKNNQFRIGNLIEHKFSEGNFKAIDKIQKTSIGTGMVSISYEDIRLIKITKEWLIKMGFVVNPFLEEGDNEDQFILEENNNTWLLIREEDDSYSVRITFNEFKLKVFNNDVLCYIKYIHELQNLYFCLTSNEIKLK